MERDSTEQNPTQPRRTKLSCMHFVICDKDLLAIKLTLNDL